MAHFFIHPERLMHALYVIPLLIVIYFLAVMIRARKINSVLGNAHRTENGGAIGVNASGTKRFIRFFFLLLSIICALLCYAKPHWGTQLRSISGAGRDIIFALDLSRSMYCSDAPPTRYEHAKYFITQALKRLKGDRYGLVCFAGDAYKVCPLTFDRLSFEYILNEQAPDIIPIGGTDFSCAITTALNAFPDSVNNGNYAVVLISDGGVLTHADKNAMARMKKANVPLICVGVGDPQTPSSITLPNKQILRDAKKEVVRTKLEEGALRELVESAPKGEYMRSDALNLNDDQLIASLKAIMPDAQSESTQEIPIDRWPYFAGTACAFFLLFLLMNERKKPRKTVSDFKTILKITSLILITFSALILHAEESDTIIMPRSMSDSETVEDYFNVGRKALANGDLKTAESFFSEVIARRDIRGDVYAAAAQNLGLIYHERGRNHYKIALVLVNETDTVFYHLRIADEAFETAENYYRRVLKNSNYSNFSEVVENQIILQKNKQDCKNLNYDVNFMLTFLQNLPAISTRVHAVERQSNLIVDAEKRAQAHEYANRAFDAFTDSMRHLSEVGRRLNFEKALTFSTQVDPLFEEIHAAFEQSRLADETADPRTREGSLSGVTAFRSTYRLKGERGLLALRDALHRLSREQAQQAGAGDEGTPQEGAGEGGENESPGEGESKSGSEDAGEQESQGGGEEEKEIEMQAAESILKDMANEERARREEYRRRIRANARKVDKDW